MKKTRKLLLLFLLLTVFSQANAQKENEVPQELLLSTLNGVSHLKIDNDQITKLMDYNKGFVDEVYKILDSEKDDKYIKKSLENLNDQRETDLREIIGKSKTNKYLKYMEDEAKPLAKKDHRLKPIVKS